MRLEGAGKCVGVGRFAGTPWLDTFPALLNGVSIFIQQNMSRDRGGVGQVV